MMKSRPPFLALLAGVALVAAVAIPSPSRGGDNDYDPAVAPLLREVAEQQATILDNEGKMDEKIAAITEQVRQARIFASRSR